MKAEPKPAIYWDSCNFIALIKQEPGFEVLERILEDAEAGHCTIYTSAFTLAEVTKKGDQSLAQGTERQITAFFENDYLVLIDVSRLIGELARRIIWSHGLRPADAVHTASALYARVDLFQTSDDRLLRRDGQIQGLRIEKPHWAGQLPLPGAEGGAESAG